MNSREVLDGVYEVTTDLDSDLWQRCLGELQVCRQLDANGYYTEPDLGAKSILAKGKACRSVAKYFGSDSWLDWVVDACAHDNAWSTNWAVPSVKWFRQHTSYSSDWHMAPAHYVDHEWHVDCLRMVVHGLMFLTDYNDPNSTTLFRQGARQVAITTGHNRGWMLLQNGRQEHRGFNNTEAPRYVFKWMYSLQIRHLIEITPL